MGAISYIKECLSGGKVRVRRLSGAPATMVLETYPTVSLPDASGYPAGSSVFDETRGVPVFSNGTAWVVAGAQGSLVFMGGADTAATFFMSLNAGGPVLAGAPTDGIPLKEGDVLSDFLVKVTSDGGNPTGVILSIGESTSGDPAWGSVNFGGLTLVNGTAVKGAPDTVTVPASSGGGSGSGGIIPTYFFIDGISAAATAVRVDLSFRVTRA